MRGFNGSWVLERKEQKGLRNLARISFFLALWNRDEKQFLLKTKRLVRQTQIKYTLSTLQLSLSTATKVQIYSKIIVNCAHQRCSDWEREKLWLDERTCIHCRRRWRRKQHQCFMQLLIRLRRFIVRFERTTSRLEDFICIGLPGNGWLALLSYAIHIHDDVVSMNPFISLNLAALEFFSRFYSLSWVYIHWLPFIFLILCTW